MFPQCTSCGPGLLGRCMGPDICCGARIGCFMGSRETRLCRTENMVPIRCTNGDMKQCGRMQEGRCAAPGFCCTESKYLCSVALMRHMLTLYVSQFKLIFLVFGINSFILCCMLSESVLPVSPTRKLITTGSVKNLKVMSSNVEKQPQKLKMFCANEANYIILLQQTKISNAPFNYCFLGNKKY